MTKLNSFLLICVFLSSIFLVQSRYKYRLINSELDVQKQEQIKIKEETEKLNYEYASYAQHNNILRWAAANSMIAPSIENVIFVETK
jgi:cell division protein FtsL